MRRDFAPRLLHYLTLALTGACLVYAEYDFLPEMAWALPAYLALVFVAGWLDGSWVMPIWGAMTVAMP